MSEPARMSSKDVKRWLERETGSIFIPVHNRARKLLGEMVKTLEGLAESSKMLLENTSKEIEKRSAKTFRRARALNKLARLFLERTQHIKTPTEVSYGSLLELVQEIQKVLIVIEVDIRNWFPRISPFFIIDRRKFQIAFEKTKESLKELGNFVAKEYVKTKTLEETFQLTDKLLVLEEQLKNQKEQKEKSQHAQTSLEREMAETQQEIAILKNKGSLSQLNQLDAEIDALETELKHNLQHLQKPFVKLQSLSLRGGGSGLIQDESNKLDHYLTNPFEAFTTEDANYPQLRAILEKLDHSMPEKLNLKPEKERKAKQAINNILNGNSLMPLHQKCVDVVARKKQLLKSAEVAEAQANMMRLQEQLASIERRKRIMESEKAVADRAYDETMEKIRTSKSSIEKNVFDFMERKIQVE